MKTRNFADVIRAQLAADPELAKLVAIEELRAKAEMVLYAYKHREPMIQKDAAEFARIWLDAHPEE